MTLDTPVTQLDRVGTTLAKRLAILGIRTVRDLLWYFPFRYEDFRRIAPLKDVQVGEQVTVRGTIEIITAKRSPRKRTLLTEAVITDGTDQLRVVWFGQPFLAKTLHAGDTVFLSGKISEDMFGLSLMSPAYEKIAVGQETTHTARIVPIYPTTAGVTQKHLRSLVAQVIGLAEHLPDWLPEPVRKEANVITLGEAIDQIHFPRDGEAEKQAARRLKFDEIFILQLRAEMIRQARKRSVAPMLAFQEEPIRAFVGGLPFPLTGDQKISAWEIMKDLGQSEPMNRLLEGDVGSGKTVVAALALYLATLHGYQGVLMAPTEILAKQHYESLRGLLGSHVPVALLTRSQFYLASEKVTKTEVQAGIESGHAAVVIGTHALLGDAVQFRKLGLVIVDEQHRFGVGQRKIIREKSGMKDAMPHFLSMTATPIPRSFALTLYGDLDLSVIRELPPGRKPIMTRLVDPHRREQAYQFIRDEIKKGRQAFVICPLIDTDQAGDEKKTVMAEYKKLSETIFPDLNIGYLHGKMKPKEKDETMKRFAEGTLHILVSTSVVEVGVNIPNASVMMVEGAERFGLAQLHQFRGRVGRSVHQSYCLVFTDSDSVTAKERLAFFEKTTDGFALAEYDLETRGPGEVYGTSQSGLQHFRLATMRDVDIIKEARQLARGLDFDVYPSLRERVQAWEETVHLE